MIAQDITEFLRTDPGRWTAFTAYLLAAHLLSRLAEWVLSKRIRALTLKTKTDLDTRIVDIAAPLVRWAIFLILTSQGLNVLKFQPWIHEFIVDVFKAGYAVLIALFLARMVDLALDYYGNRLEESGSSQLKKTLFPALSKMSKFAIGVVVILLILQNAGYQIGSLLAGLGIGGLAVALAAQNTLANFFGSITIFGDKPYVVGDRIKIQGLDGTVEAIGLRSTQLRSLDGTLISIPNRQVVESSIDNVSMRPSIKHMFTLNLTYDTSAEKMKEAVGILRNIYQKHPATHDYWVYWRDFGPHSLDILVIFWCKHLAFKEFLIANEEINLEIKTQFEEAGLEFAFPTQTLHLENAYPKQPPRRNGDLRPSTLRPD
jgi:MscS family membrane protein